MSPPHGRIRALSAGTLLAAGPAVTVDLAADAGFAHVGVRVDPSAAASVIASVSARLAARSLRVFDVEVIRLGVTTDAEADALVDAACALDASWLLVTSHLSDPSETTRALLALVKRLAAVGARARPALEFMAFTEVRTVLDAIPIARQAGSGLVIDALHVHRNGHLPATVREALGDDPLPLYLQVCDTDRTMLGDDQLVDEARHGRLLPGTGILPLRDLLAALPGDTPVTVEVQSDALVGAVGAAELARRCAVALDDLLRPEVIG